MSEEPLTDPNGPAETPSSERKFLSVRQAAFIGVGAMVGAGILVLSVALDFGWKHVRGTRTKNVQLVH